MLMKTKQHPLTGKQVSGLFELRLLLIDYSIDEYVDAITRQVTHEYETFRREKHAGMFAPVFCVTQEDPHKLTLEITAPGSGNSVGKIPLKIKTTGKDAFVTMRKVAPRKYHQHSNAGFTLTDLKVELEPHRTSLPSDEHSMLSHWLAYFEDPEHAAKAIYSFDLDRNDESLTLVAFADFKRSNSITLFY